MRSVLKVAVLVLLGLGLSGCAWLFTPLQAVLTATPTSGVAPLSVTFSAAGSTGAIAAFTLDFETDGTVDHTGTDITVNVNHTYTTPGTYTATLTVQDNRGRTDTDTVTITVSPPPTTTVSLGAIPASGPAPLNDVLFWANIQAAPGRRIKHIKLEYGDGTPDFEADVDFTSYDFFLLGADHDYTDPDTYTATLRVRDDATPPQAFTATATITVTSPPPEITSFTATPATGPEPLTVDFDFTAQAAPGRKIVKYTLLCAGSDIPSQTEDLLNLSTLTRTNIMRDYTQTGSYTATVKVWDDLNNTDEESLTIEVTAAP